MTETECNNLQRYLYYAENNINRWKKYIGCQLNNSTYGVGIINIATGSIPISTTIDVDGGGDYIFEGGGLNSIITSVSTTTCFNITNAKKSSRLSSNQYLEKLKNFHGFDIDEVELLRNCVYPPLGLHILSCALSTIQQPLTIFSKSKLRGEG